MNPLTPTLTQLAWSQIWQVTALTLAVGILVRLTCRRRPHLAYALWMLVLLKSLTPPLWSSPTGIFSWAQLKRVEHPAATGQLGFAGMPAMPEPFAGPDREEATAATTSPTPATPTPPNRTPLTRADGLALAWLAGAALLSTWLATKWLATRRWLARSCTPAEPRWQALADDLCRRLGIHRTVRLFTGDASLGPAAFGCLRPKILLPAALLESKPITQIEPVLAHELMHVRRCDPAAGKLQLLAQILWWFHPLLWWTNRELRRHRERACDEEVLARLGCPPALYARTLLDLLAWRRALRPAFAFPALRPWEVTSKRLEHIMSNSQRFNTRMPWWCWFLLGAGLALVLPGAGFTREQPTSVVPEKSVQQSKRKEAANEPPLAPVVRANCAVLPVQTALHKLVVEREATVVVLMNDDAKVDPKSEDPDPNGLDSEALFRDLLPYARTGTGTVVLYSWKESKIRRERDETSQKFRSELLQRLNRFGFRYVSRHDFGPSIRTWQPVHDMLTSRPLATPGTPEEPIGNEVVQVYPVRTALGRYLTRGADCFVDILEEFPKEAEPGWNARVRDSIAKYVRKLHLDRKEMLRFRVWGNDRSRDVRLAALLFVEGEGTDLATDLGFERATLIFGPKPSERAAPPAQRGDSESTLREQWNALNEDQARAVTQRHLHGLARAVHDYHRVHNKFPPAVVPNDKLPPEKRLSGLVLLLPHLDVESWNEPGKPCFPEEMARAANELFKTIDLNKAWDDPANLQAARTVVPAFLAPRGGPFRDDNGFAVSHFAFIRGAKGDDNGVFPGERALDFEELAGQDGASATLALGQINRRLGPWIAAGTSSARYVYHPLDAGAPAMVATFDSNFEGGCYFAKADSSTFFILDETEADILYALTTRAGGELFDDDAVKTRPPPRNPSEPRT